MREINKVMVMDESVNVSNEELAAREALLDGLLMDAVHRLYRFMEDGDLD